MDNQPASLRQTGKQRQRSLPRCFVGASANVFALFEIDLLFALPAGMFLVELVGENLNFSTAVVAFAHE
jgi:hypothetical protein